MENNLVHNGVTVKRNSKKVKLPKRYVPILEALEDHLSLSKGKPLGRGWKNYGPYKQMGPNCYHCHLHNKYVAVWNITKEGGNTICEIVYAGTREKIPKK